jgi:hypothetical protein
MADVTGSIGNEYVELNNAATEATLKQLLAATLKMGGSTNATASTAGAAGVNTASIEAAKAAAKAQKELGEKADNLKKTFSALAEGMMQLGGKLLQGTDKSSDLFAAFERLPGVAGLVASGFAKVARFQEENLATYQKITDAGVSFGGSLTDMRTAAASTYMTLDQFAGLMKRNSETFAKMGGTAEQGARAFTSMSNSLMKSEAGDNLRALGYTSEQVNEGLAGYLANTGARTKQEMQNTAAITKGAGEYLTQLDQLATITGKSREEQEKALKQANANAAYEQMKMGMTEEQRAAYDKGLAEMSAKFGKAGEDLFKSQAMGLPPMTEAAQKLQALSPEVAKASQGMADVGKRGGKVAETMRYSAEATEGAAQAAKRLSGVSGALSFSSDSTSQALMGLTKESNRARAQGTESAAEGEKQRQEIAEEQKKRRASEAADAVQAQKAMQELGQAILSALLPVIKMLTPVINAFATVVKIIATQFEKLNGIVQILIVTGLAYLAYQKLKSAREAAGQIPSAGDLGGGGKGGGAGKGGLGKALGAAGKVAKIGGVAGAVMGAANLYSSFGDINDKVKSGKMSEEDASKEKAGVVGETGGGLAGGIAGAAAGAAIGSVVPIIGTMIGGLIGGAIGSYGGSSLGKSAADALTGQKKAADGLMVNTPTSILAGEAGPEIVAPTKHFENLQNELQTLNKQTVEMLRFLKETAEHTRNTADATKQLGGDLFKF